MTDGLAEAENSAKWPTPATRDHKGSNSADHLENGTGRRHLGQLPNFVEHVFSKTPSVSARPTPRASESGPDFAKADRSNTGMALPAVAAMFSDSAASPWATPRASDGEKGGPNQAFGAGGVPLAAQAAQWSTPSVADVTGGRASRSGNRKDELLLNSQAKAVSTLSAKITPSATTQTPATVSSETAGLFAIPSEPQPDTTTSPESGSLWPTPRVATGDYTRDRGSAGAERLTLEGRSKALPPWPTPTSLSFKDSHQPGNSASMNRTLDLASDSSLQAPETSPDGEMCSPERRTLNPLFVAWLMGWPGGWTSFACSATGLSRFKARMRSALSQLVSPPVAPPAQLSLFG